MKLSDRLKSLFVVALLVNPVTGPQAIAAVPQEAAPVQERDREQELKTPESYLERVQREGTVLELNRKEAIRLALINNLEISIENYNEDLSREEVVKNQGFYDPTLNFTLGWNSSDSPTTSTLDAGGGITVSQFDGFTFDTSLRQNVKGGGAFNVSFGNQRVLTNSTFSIINPRYNSDFTLSFTQPLLKGFRRTTTERQIKISNLNIEISDTEFQQRVAEIIQQVENQYWELAYAVANYETQRKSVDLAIIQHRNNQKRVQIGVMAPIEITSSEAEVARREQTLIQSEVQIINAQNGLKRLLAADPDADIWGLTLIPTDRPDLSDVQIGLDEAIRTAISRRPELERMNLQMEQNLVDEEFYRQEGRPTVNLRAQFGSVGATGTVFKQELIDIDGDGVPDEIGPPVENPNDPRFGAFPGSWNQLFKFDFRNWGIFFDVQLPLKNRTNDADMAMVRIRERQLQSMVKNEQQLIMVEVRNAYETITTRKKSLEAARKARELAQEQLDGENKRFEAGLSTNFEVLRFQRDLAENEVSELRAMLDYQLALTALDKAMYTIIEASDISLARDR